MTRPPAGTGKTVAAEAAERAQAEYYRGLLTERRAEIDLAIVKLLTATPHHEARSDLGGVVRDAERERRDIDRMIGALDRRFPRADLTPVATPSPSPSPDETIPADGRSLLSMGPMRRAVQTAGRMDHEKVS